MLAADELGGELDIAIRTLTPLWTGDSLGESDHHIQSTGIMGSLRWWFETLVRGVGGRACNPVGRSPSRNARGHIDPNGKCQFNASALPEALIRNPQERREALWGAGLCDVCQIFGTTGWRRRFRLTADDRKLRPTQGWSNPLVAKVVSSTQDAGRKSNPPTWYFKSEGLEGTLGIRLLPTDSTDYTPLIAGVLSYIARWGVLGARSQVGFGVVQLESQVDPLPLYFYLSMVQGSVPLGHYDSWPHLGNMFFSQFSAPSSDRIELAQLKVELRALFRPDHNVRHDLLGTARGRRRASKIKVSAPYGNPERMRVWGWVPNVPWRNNALERIHSHLQTRDPNLTWQEMGSTRDARHGNVTALQFVADLLGVSP